MCVCHRGRPFSRQWALPETLLLWPWPPSRACFLEKELSSPVMPLASTPLHCGVQWTRTCTLWLPAHAPCCMGLLSVLAPPPYYFMLSSSCCLPPGEDFIIEHHTNGNQNHLNCWIFHCHCLPACGGGEGLWYLLAIKISGDTCRKLHGVTANAFKWFDELKDLQKPEYFTWPHHGDNSIELLGFF